jgi:protocatechuate 3,4-dioxygenase beta subunit
MKRIIGQTFLSLLTLPAVFRLSRRTGLFDVGARISRGALLKLAGLGIATLAARPWRDRSPAIAASSTSVSDAPACVLSPEQTQGPYYIPREKIRSNLREHKPGTSLQLRLTVVDASTCKPIKGAAVDIWHCDAGGIYAGFVSASTGGPPGGNAGPTDKNTFLRGIQRTNARGVATFQTIYPGWYRGRTVHIHVIVHLGGVVVGHIVHTGQLFFSDALTSNVYQTGVYKVRAAARDTFNNTDSVYASGGAQSMLTMKHDGHGGYIGTITLGVRNK